MTEARFDEFIEDFVKRRRLPVAETLKQLRRTEDYDVAFNQCRAGASSRVLTMLLERALRQ